MFMAVAQNKKEMTKEKKNGRVKNASKKCTQWQHQKIYIEMYKIQAIVPPKIYTEEFMARNKKAMTSFTKKVL